MNARISLIHNGMSCVSEDKWTYEQFVPEHILAWQISGRDVSGSYLHFFVSLYLICVVRSEGITSAI